MFRKSLAAVAVLGAFAATSMAAEVSLYGIVDYGMLYQHAEYPGIDNTAQHQDDLTLNSGVNSASRFGIKGTEELGNGYKVSFQLENGFDADDGNLSTENKLFDREARLTISSQWGELSAGRMGALSSAAGTYDTVYSIGDAFDGGDNDIFTGVVTERYDNMLTYRSPKVAGLQATAQYSFEAKNKWNEGSDYEGHAKANRYAGLALTGEYGNFQTVIAYEQVLISSLTEDLDDPVIASIGANYDFGVAKVFAMGQYFESANGTSLGQESFDVGSENLPFMVDGYALHVGTQLPLAAGTLTAGVYYSDADGCENLFDVDEPNFKSVAGSVKYEYPLSVRTMLYGSMGYGELKADWGNGDSTKLKLTQVYAGIQHTF